MTNTIGEKSAVISASLISLIDRHLTFNFDSADNIWDPVGQVDS